MYINPEVFDFTLQSVGPPLCKHKRTFTIYEGDRWTSSSRIEITAWIWSSWLWALYIPFRPGVCFWLGLSWENTLSN